MEVASALIGCRDMTATLRRVLVRRPREDVSSWRSCGWRSEPDPFRLAAEHEAFAALLEDAGADVVVAGPTDGGNLDEVYAFDPALVTEDAVVLLRPGKELRQREPMALEAELRAAGMPVAGRLEPPAEAEGGDLIRFDGATLLAGHGYRTNGAGTAALSELLPGVDVVSFDLPHYRGRGEVMHLLTLISPLDRDLAVAFLPLLPVRLVQLLEERGVQVVDVPEEEFQTMGCNVLALGPRRALAVEGNPETRRRMERAGVEVVTYEGAELSKGDGGPTCLTLPLQRR
jgi:N-dimethylarginine dimethylaminohydrolase